MTLSDIPWTGKDYTFDWVDVQRVWVYTKTSFPEGGDHQQIVCVDDVRYNEPVSAVPEPASCALLALAVGGIGTMLKKRRKR